VPTLRLHNFFCRPDVCRPGKMHAISMKTLEFHVFLYPVLANAFSRAWQ
jgi:hypothetical protein